MKILAKIIFLFLLLQGYNGHSQTVKDTRLDSLVSMLTEQIRSDQHECLYLNTDKSIYLPGEAVWFRAFLVNSLTDKFSQKSHTVFINLIDQENRVLKTLLLQTSSLDLLTGKIDLPDNLPGGYYWIRAYTIDMARNFPEGIATEPVYIYNTDQSEKPMRTGIIASANPDSLLVNFYPEGGILITGAPSLLALRITDMNNLPVSDSGVIKDNDNQVAGIFKSGKYGIGSLTIEPSHYRKYDAYISNKGKMFHYALPAFNMNAGQVSAAYEDNGLIRVRVLLEDSLFNKDPNTYLVAISGDSICFASRGNGNYQFNVPSQKFPPGIVTFYLFSNSQKLLSTRSIYINRSDILNASLDNRIFERRQKADLHINVANNEGKPLLSSLSVAVVNDHFLKPLAQDNPNLDNWDLSMDSSMTNHSLNILLLTGKPTLEENLRSGNNGVVVNNDSILFIQGRVLESEETPVPGKVVSLLSLGKDKYFQTDTTDARGRFCFKLGDYPDSSSFNIRVLNENKTKKGIHIAMDPHNFNLFAVPETEKRYLVLQPHQIRRFMDTTTFVQKREVLPPVIINNAPKNMPDYDTSKRISIFSQVISGSEIEKTGFEKLGDALLSLGGLRMLYGYIIFGGPTDMNGVDATTEPLIVLDGVEMDVSLDNTRGYSSPDLNFLDNISTRSIDFVEIIKGPDAASFGMKGAHGVIVINTRASARENASESTNKTSENFHAAGYYIPEPFKETTYERRAEKKSSPLDTRSTLYWNGNVRTGQDGKATVTFYTNDVPGQYTVVLKGITEQGIIIEKSIPFEIQ